MNRRFRRSLERLIWFALALAMAMSGGCRRCEPGFAPAACLPPVSSSGKIFEMDPALRSIVPADYDIQKLATGFAFIEGPVWVDRDPPYFLFTEVRRNEIYQWSLEGTLNVFLSPKFQGRTGPTALTLDSQGRLVVCEHGNRWPRGPLVWRGGKTEKRCILPQGPASIGLLSGLKALSTDTWTSVASESKSPHDAPDVGPV